MSRLNMVIVEEMWVSWLLWVWCVVLYVCCISFAANFNFISIRIVATKFQCKISVLHIRLYNSV